MKEPSHRLRWKLCKALGRLVDDYEFSLINREQWHWYNAMIVQDEIDHFELERDMVEYMASFWNPDSVNKIKASRKASEVHSFATDEEFSRQIKDEDYKTNRYVKAIQKINDMNDANTNRRGKSSNDIMKDMINRRKMKLPTDLAALIDEV
tara:strand:- start:498 stop:950 length:453 start_codon:yes stop_codon:yes gene_type:complete